MHRRGVHIAAAQCMQGLASTAGVRHTLSSHRAATLVMRACRASTGSIQQVAVAPFSTSGRLWEQQQTVPPQQPPLQRRSKKDDEDDDDDTVPKTLPSPPYGGRFGVPDQPLSTKAIEQLKQQQQQQQQQQQGKGSKNRSPFSRAKDGMKHKVNDWTDQEKNLQKRKELLTDFQAGYFSEFSEINRTGAKLWFASPAMMTAEKALYMPNIVGTSLKTSETVELADLLKGKISLVSISGTRFGEEQTETFVKPFLERWPAGKPGSKVQLVELNIQENPLKAGLVRVMVPFVRKTIPEERHANYLLHYKSIKHLKDPLCMQNSYLGYVFLVDGNCKIRWGAHGKGTEAEIHTLLDSVQKLSERGK